MWFGYFVNSQTDIGKSKVVDCDDGGGLNKLYFLTVYVELKLLTKINIFVVHLSCICPLYIFDGRYREVGINSFIIQKKVF